MAMGPANDKDYLTHTGLLQVDIYPDPVFTADGCSTVWSLFTLARKASRQVKPIYFLAAWGVSFNHRSKRPLYQPAH